MSKFQSEGASWLKKAYQAGESLADIRLELFSNLVLKEHPSSILDVGCGNGLFLESLVNIPVRVGIDHSQQMLDLIPEGSLVDYHLVDIEEEGAQLRLEQLGEFEMITLKGVVHYLSSPRFTLRKLLKCAEKNTVFAASFRNRLFNLKETSRYFKSPLTVSDSSILKSEREFWNSQKLPFNQMQTIGSMDFSACENIINFYRSTSSEGVTDNFWNPDKHQNWRQFTPLETIILFEDIGLKPSLLIPIRNSKTNSVIDQSKKESAICDATSFVLSGTV